MSNQQSAKGTRASEPAGRGNTRRRALRRKGGKAVISRWAFLILLLLVGPQSLRAQAPPKLVSVFPFGGQRGKALEIEVRGTGLEGTHTVWLGPGSKLESLKAPSASRVIIPYTKGPD